MKHLLPSHLEDWVAPAGQVTRSNGQMVISDSTKELANNDKKML
jgi:hypothetical protein